MKQALPILVLGTLAAGCLGDLGGDPAALPQTVVATLRFEADATQALVSKECVAIHGAAGCTLYPNQMECDTLKINVRADGKTVADCRDESGAVIHNDVATVAQVPILCRANRSLTCQTCVDVFGNTVLDTCNDRGSQLFRKIGTGWGNSLSPDSAYLEEPTSPGQAGQGVDEPAAPSQPPSSEPSPDAKCDYGHAIVLYARELNAILASEGLQLHWNPFAHAFPSPDAGQSFFNNKDKDLQLAAASNLTCQQYFANIKSKYKQCPYPGPNGQCHYCGTGLFGLGLFGNGKTCKASRINVAALQATCGKIPAECDQTSWSGAIVMAYGTSNSDLFQNNTAALVAGTAPPGGVPQVPGADNGTGTLPQGWPAGPVGANLPPATNFPNWAGSPLVLDLAGDGINLTSVSSGVSFDLVGAGPMKTGWIRGDDALLALDRNGNGSIDDGTELFGTITGGQPWEDGFQALAELDSRGLGGNADGVVDRHDRQWKRLRAWRDSNGDGVSQPSELMPLCEAGVQSLPLRPTLVPGAIDAHGNDLRLRASFTRITGERGVVVDVDFVISHR